MNHTRMSDEWIKDKVQKNPLKPILDKEGKPTGFFESGVVRFSYPNLITPKGMKGDLRKAPKRSVSLWFTPFHDLRPLYGDAIQKIAAYRKTTPEIIAQSLIPGVIPSEIGGMNTPFNDQRKKLPKPGYTPGCMFMNCSAERAIGVRRISGGQLVPVTEAEESKLIYGGMWGIATFNLFISKEVPQEQIPARLCAGLSSALLFADDMPLGVDGGPDADEVYAGVQGAEDVGLPAMGTAGMPGAPAQPGGLADWGVPAQGASYGMLPSAPLRSAGRQNGVQPQLSPQEIALRRSLGMPV